MFPRHVRWYRLLLLLLVIVNSDEAIAKTEGNLNLDSGPGIIVTCPAASSGSAACGGVAPPMQASFLNSISDGDIAAFSLIGGDISGTPCGDIIILGIETGSGTTPEGCSFITRQFIIYDDANTNGVLEGGEFVTSCNVEYIIGDNQDPEVNSSSDLYIDCFFPDREFEINNWLESGGYSNVMDCSSVTISNDYMGEIDFCSNSEVIVTFTFTDDCGNSTMVSNTIFFLQEVFIDCSPSLFIDCFNEDMLQPATSVSEYNYFLGYIQLCSDDISISHVDGVGAVSSICEVPENEPRTFERTYFFTDNTCGTVYECTQIIDVFRSSPFLDFTATNCEFGLPPSSPLTKLDLSYYGITPYGCGETTVTFVDTPHACDEEFVRTYTIEDECGSTADFTFNYIENNVLSASCQPEAIIQYCNQTYQSSGTMTPVEYFEFGSITSYCGTITIEYQDTPDNLSPCDIGIPITRDFTITTSCGAVNSCSMEFMFESEIINISCPFTNPIKFEGEIPPAFTSVEDFRCNGGFISSDCSDLTISSVVDNPPVPDFYSNDFIGVIERTYTFTNECGQSRECTQFIEYFTGPAPASSLSCAPATDIVIDCNDADPAGPTINDLVIAELANCSTALSAGGAISVSNNYSSITYTGSGTTQDVIFTLSDGAGNTLDCTKSITIIGDCPTVGANCSVVSDIVIDCNDANSLGPTLTDLIEAEIATCSATLEAGSTSPDGGPVTVTNNYLFLAYTGSGSNQDIIFTVTDNLGAETECTKSLTIVGDCKYVECPPTPFLTCEDGLPAPVTSFKAFMNMGGTYDFLGCDTLSITSSDDDLFEDLDFCSTGKIEIRRLYTLTDGCGQIFRCRRKIRYFRNTTGPVIACPAETTVDINTADCTYQATLVAPSAASNCSLLDVVSVTSQYTGNVVDLPIGQNIIEWTAIDECGRSSTCQQIINVVGTSSELSLICNSSAMAFLEADGTANVPAGQFINTVYDACGSSGPYVYQIRRLSAGSCSAGTGSIYGPSIPVCCEDLASPTIDVSIRVTDTNGNQATCTAEVQVKDLISPTLLSCPGDMNVSCSTNIDLTNLSQFGTAHATDNCPGGLSIIETLEDNREDCGLGEIVRIFTIKDLSDNTISCSQTLTVYDNDPLQHGDIVWPVDNTYTNLCNDDIPTPAVAGVPTYPTSFCSQPLVTSSDNVFVEGPGCITVSRNWVVLDWCQFDQNADPNTYRWEHTQIITLQNNIKPVFDLCESYVETCGNEQTCTGMINLTMTATDDCASASELRYAYTLTLESGAIINGEGNSINAPYPYGEHSVVWSVTDQCGNYTTCAQTVLIKDCKPPNAVCLSGVNINLTQMPGNIPMAEIWAKDLNVSSIDNCTPENELEFAFDVNFTQPAMTFTCSDVGTGTLVRMYVRDGDGNVGFCKTTITIQDNHNLCPDLITDEVIIAGRIATESNLLMQDVDVMLETAQLPMHYMTDENGQYAFENLPMYDDFMLIPTFEDEILNGISTADILLIQRHILGLQTFDSPYKIIAADVNNSESISGTDIIELRKVILGIQEEFKQSTVWRFVDPSNGMVDPDHPFPYSENMNLTDLDHSADNMDFVGVKTGDVNYSALINGFIPETNISFRSQETLRLISNSLERGSVQLTVNNDQVLSGFQLAFRISGSIDQFDLSSSIIDIDESNYAIHDDIVKISWSTPEAIELAKGTELFSMSLDQDADYELLHDLPLFDTEAYTADVRSMEVQINVENNIVNEEWQVFRNTPNPFFDYTSIPFNAPKDSQLSLSVFDVNGKLLFTDTRNVKEGYQQWELSATDLGNVHGVLYYRLESDDFSSTQPFIRLK